MDPLANDPDAETSESVKKITDDIEVLNIEGYEGYEDECIIVLRTKKENYPQAFDTIKNAGQHLRHPSKHDEPSGSQPRLESLSSSEITDRVECIRLEGYENIRDGLYIIFRMQEKKQKANGEEISETITDEGHFNDSPTSSTDTILSTESTNASQSDTKITYESFMNLLQNLRNPSGFSFDDVKEYLLTNGVIINSKQLSSFLYRATEKKILEKSAGGYKHYTFKS